MSVAGLPCRFASQAEADLEDIAQFIAAGSVGRALSFVVELKEHCLKIAENPTAYVLREEYGAGVRVAVHGRYLNVHAARGDALVIERILHGARHLDWVKL